MPQNAVHLPGFDAVQLNNLLASWPGPPAKHTKFEIISSMDVHNGSLLAFTFSWWEFASELCLDAAVVQLDALVPRTQGHASPHPQRVPSFPGVVTCMLQVRDGQIAGRNHGLP